MIKAFIRGSIFFVLILLFSLSYIFFSSFNPDTLRVLQSINKKYLLLSLFFVFLVHTFDNLRLYVISRAMGVKYSLLYGYVISFINTFGATITPAHVGGEGTTVYMLARKGVNAYKIACIVTLKTLTGMAFFVLFSPLFIYQILREPENALRLFGIMIIFSLAVFLLFKIFRKGVESSGEKGREWLRKLKSSFKRYLVHLRFFYRERKKEFLLATLFGILLYVSFFTVGIFLLKAFNENVNFLKAFYQQISLVYAIFVSPTPGGSGVGELGGMMVFGNFLSKAELGVFVVLWRTISQYMSAFIGGIIFLICLLKDLRSFS
ncbi:flippase-like domain-containing protein [Aquifex sp.]